MDKIAKFMSDANEFVLLKIFTPVFCVAALIALILYVAVKCLPLYKLPEKIRKGIIAVAKVTAKVFGTIGKLPTVKVLIIGGSFYALMGLFIALGSKPVKFLSLIFCPILGGAIGAGALFLILLCIKGLAVALGNVMGDLGDQEAYNDVVRTVNGKFIVFKDEDGSMYPEDLVVHSNETREECERRQRAGEAERQQAYREQRKAQRRYLDAKHRYDHAATLYRQCVATGDTQGALLYRETMDKELVEMRMSGYEG